MTLTSAHTSAIRQSFCEEGRDLLRGAAGGLIFGTPLLFTMEMWFHGMHFAPGHLIGILFFITLINLSFSYASGLREHNKGHTILGALADSITALALGIIVAIGVLALIGQLSPDEGLNAMLGKIVIEAGAVSIGTTFTNNKFKKGKTKASRVDKLEKAELSDEQKQARLDFQNLAAVLAGAVIFSFNVAPTEEIVMIAASQTPLSLLILLGAEMLLCYIILYAADFKEHKVYKRTHMQSEAAEVIMTVAISLIVGGILLALIGEAEVMDSPNLYIACVIALGFPAVVGGAAGKLVV